jgi:thioredoxin reductase
VPDRVAPASEVATGQSRRERPFPPGDYPLIVVGSGPGALQTTYSLRALGVPHAVISADDAPGGMFRRWPFFQRLLSWTKPFAPPPHPSRDFERWDWNSLLGDEPETRAIMPDLMDGSSSFPSRPEMEQNLRLFAERAAIAIRYGTRWTATRRDGEQFVLETTDGEYRTPTVVFAVGVAEPWMPATPGMDLVAHYAQTRAGETYAGKRIFIIGKQNSGFELASGLLAWAKGIVLASPSPAKLSVNTNSLVGIRARYLQPYEDHAIGGGVGILNASIELVERAEGGDGALRVTIRRTDNASLMTVSADEVIAATGFVSPLQDLPALGVATFGQSRLPALTPFFESASVPGIFFAGTIGQAQSGLKKHGIPPNSGAVHGARYNARFLARHIARTRFGIEAPRPEIAPGDLLDYLLAELSRGPEIWHQKSYLARVVSLDAGEGIRDEGIQPLAPFVDSESGSDAIAVTLEADGTGSIYPAVYVRRNGAVEEKLLTPHPLLDYSTDETRSELGDLLARVVPSAGTVNSGTS